MGSNLCLSHHQKDMRLSLQHMPFTVTHTK